MAVQISIYLNEADEWHRRPLHIQILNYLREENVAGATVIHAVAGFTGRSRVQSSSLVDVGGKLPLIVTFIDTDEHVSRVMPRLREMAANRLIVREEVIIEQGSLE
jgi:PII-like signaling protein